MMSFVLLAPTLSTALRVPSLGVVHYTKVAATPLVLHLCMYCTSCIHSVNCLIFVM